MATAEIVKAETRSAGSRGKNEARRLRRSGSIPGVVYGARQESIAVALDPKQIRRILSSESGHNTIFDLAVGQEQSKVMIVDWQYDPVKGSLLHIDMKRIAMDVRLKVSVPILLKGEAAGVKTQGGILEQILREVELECLPTDIPTHIDVDVTELVFGQVIRVKDLPHLGKLTFVTEENQPVAHIVSVKEEEVAAVAEPGLEGAAEAPAEKPEKAEKKEKK